MTKYVIIIFLISMVCISSCTKEIEDNQNISYDYTLEAVDTISIELDSTTSPKIEAIRYLENSAELALLNKSTYQIILYDLNSGKQIKKITFMSEGEDGIPSGIKGMYYYSEDSIFISNGYSIFLCNSLGKVLHKYSLNAENISYSFQVFFLTQDQPFIKNDSLICVIYADLPSLSLSAFRNKVASVFALNLKNGKGKCIAFYPSDYEKGLYGNNYTYTFLTTNPDKSIIYSYPVGDYIYKGGGEKIFAKSKYIDKITPANTIEDNPMGHTSFFVTSPSYGPIYYDKYQNMYVRVAEMPRSKEDFINKKWWKKKTLILLDEKLKIIGEVQVENDYLNVYQCFSTPDGFYITLGSNKDENKKSFIGFKLKRIVDEKNTHN
jgi:hypothetical protein